MNNDDFTILVVSSEGRGVKSLSARMVHMKIFMFCALGLACVSIVSAVFAFNYYKKSEVVKLEKHNVVSQLSVLAEHSIQNDVTKKIYNDKLKVLEEQLMVLHDMLSKKGIKSKLSVGGEYEPANRYSLSYIDFLSQDVSELDELFSNLPIGIPINGRVNSAFGYRKDPFNSKMAFHSGVDISAKNGSPVVATADGVVKEAGWKKALGRAVVIQHKDGYKTVYGHLAKILVSRGQKIEAGQFVGQAGSSGRSSGPHLHYEVAKNGKKVNPKQLMNVR